jgi:hypothetical protein
VIPLYERVVFVRLLSCSEFPGRLSKIIQALDAITGIQFRVQMALDERRTLGQSPSTGAPAYDRGSCRLSVARLVAGGGARNVNSARDPAQNRIVTDARLQQIELSSLRNMGQ